MEETPETPVTVLDDGASRALQVARSALGAFSVDEAVLSARAQMLAAYPERLQHILDYVAARVPRERLVVGSSSLTGPILDRLTYIEDTNPLRLLYLTLLTQAIDKEHQSIAHPGFIHIIEQLCRDEAVLIFCLKQQHLEMTKRNGAFAPGRRAATTAFYLPNIAPDIDPEEIPKGLVEYPKHMKMYLSHLLSLNLIKIRPPVKVDHDTEWLTWIVCPSEFGALFLSACVPASGSKPNV